MKYPIDTDSYISDIRKEYGLREDIERIYRKQLIPLLNDSYQAGIKGCWNNPMDAEKIIAEFAPIASFTLTDWHRELIKCLIAWCNDAYAQGRQDAETGQC